MNRTVFIFWEKPHNSAVGRIVVRTSVGGRLCRNILRAKITFFCTLLKRRRKVFENVDILIFHKDIGRRKPLK